MTVKYTKQISAVVWFVAALLAGAKGKVTTELTTEVESESFLNNSNAFAYLLYFRFQENVRLTISFLLTKFQYQPLLQKGLLRLNQLSESTEKR